MAQIKIKRTTGSTPPTGLTFGELAYVQGIKSVYIGQTGGDPALRIGAEVDTSTSLGTSDNKIPTQNAVKTYIDNNVAAGAVASLNGLTGAVFLGAGTGIQLAIAGKGITLTNTGVQSLAGTSNQISVSGATGAVTLSLPSTVTVPGALNVTTNLTVTGNLTVNGTTTTVNSDSMTIDDPLLTLGTSGGVPIAASDGGKDRGIAFNYYDTAGRTGFFGYDASANEFVFQTRATITNDVSTGVSFGNARIGGTLLLNTTAGTDSIVAGGGGYVFTLPSGYAGEVVASGTYPNADNYILKSATSLGSPAQPVWIDPSVAGFTAFAATRLTTGAKISVSGDVTATGVTFDGTGNIALVTTIAANSVELGTDTTGNYLATLTTSSTGLTVANSGTESAAVTINFATITTGLNMGTFSFASGEFTNSSGTISLGVVDGGSY
jgi:hypothetical protein